MTFISRECKNNNLNFTTCKEEFSDLHTIEEGCGGIYQVFSENWHMSENFSKKVSNLFIKYPQVHRFRKIKNLTLQKTIDAFYSNNTQSTSV